METVVVAMEMETKGKVPIITVQGKPLKQIDPYKYKEFNMSKVVTVNKDDCTSCGLCTDTLPKVFRLDADDLAESHNDDANVNKAVVDGADIDKVQETIDDCPGECIHWV